MIFYKPTKYKQTSIGQVPEDWDIDILQNLIDTITPPKKIKKLDFNKKGKYPIIDQSQEYIVGWTDDISAVIKEEMPLVIFGDHTCIVKYIDFPFVQGADGVKILKTNNNLRPLYLFYYLEYDPIKSEGYRRHFAKLKEKIIIFSSNIKEQQKISEVLSKIDEAIETVNEGIEKWQRIKKAAMRQLLTRGIGHKKFKYVEGVGEVPEEWEVKKLEKVFTLEYGKALDKKCRKPEGEYPVYGANGVKDRSDIFYYDKKTLVIGRKGSAGEVVLTESKFWPLDVTYYVVFDDKKYDLLFLYYLLKFIDLTKLAHGVKPGLNRNDVYDIEAPLPALPEQQRIVVILQKIDEVIQTKQQKKKHLERVKREMMRLLLTGRVRIKV